MIRTPRPSRHTVRVLAVAALATSALGVGAGSAHALGAGQSSRPASVDIPVWEVPDFPEITIPDDFTIDPCFQYAEDECPPGDTTPDTTPDDTVPDTTPDTTPTEPEVEVSDTPMPTAPPAIVVSAAPNFTG